MIIFKPNGTLDVATDPSDLPAESVNKNTISYAMQRCKNLRLDDMGVVKTRYGSQKINSTIMEGTPEFIFENSGYRYVFTTDGNIYRDEETISGGKCATPSISPDTGEYAEAQTVTMSTTTAGASIYYTLDGSTPDETSLVYSGDLTVGLFTEVKAVSIRTGFVNSDVARVYYSAEDANIVTETDQDTLITETDSDNVISEGIG